MPDALSVVDAGNGVVLIAGELDASTSGLLRRRLLAPPPVRVIDLSEVTFIDASGLRVLLEAIDRRSPSSDLRLRTPSRRVVRLCEIAGLAGTLLGARDTD